jgi:antitoxin (DNA-binding transcriptional repressor) of toxin-antitoxin stability system
MKHIPKGGDMSAVGVRQFRAAIAEYIDGEEPVEVTRHGEVVGVFIPMHKRKPNPAALIAATNAVRESMPEADIDEMVTEFDSLRRNS